MNKLIAIAVSLAALALLSTGCASSSTVRRLEAQNRELTKRVAQMQKRVHAAQRQARLQPPNPALTRPMIPPTGMRPNLAPVARQMAGTPQNWAYLNRPSEMCAGTALHYEFENRSGQFLALMLDGDAVQVVGESTNLPHLPPGRTAHFCLLRLGRHTLQGVGFIGRPPRLVRSGRFTKNLNITPSRLGHFDHVYAEDIR